MLGVILFFVLRRYAISLPTQLNTVEETANDTAPVIADAPIEESSTEEEHHGTAN